jgi:protein NrfD
LSGLLFPLLLESLESRRALPATLAAPALLLLGGFALRWIFVAAGQAL